MTPQLTTLVLPSNLLDLSKIDDASAWITFRAPGSDKVHEAIISGRDANRLNWGHNVIVHHTPATLDLYLPNRAYRKANIVNLENYQDDNFYPTFTE